MEIILEVTVLERTKRIIRLEGSRVPSKKKLLELFRENNLGFEYFGDDPILTEEVLEIEEVGVVHQSAI